MKNATPAVQRGSGAPHAGAARAPETAAPDDRERDPLDPQHWIDEHAPVLYRYALSRVRQPEVAEELVQQTLLIALEKRASFEGRSSVRTWLVGILRMLLLRLHAAQARDQLSVEIERLAVIGFNEKGYWTQSPGPLPSTADRAEFAAAFEQCLAGLPLRTREVFLLVEQHAVPVDEVCKELGVSRTHLYVTLHRARHALRRCLEGKLKGKVVEEGLT